MLGMLFSTYFEIEVSIRSIDTFEIIYIYKFLYKSYLK